jgi:hypothetical protein
MLRSERKTAADVVDGGAPLPPKVLENEVRASLAHVAPRESTSSDPAFIPITCLSSALPLPLFYRPTIVTMKSTLLHRPLHLRELKCIGLYERTQLHIQLSDMLVASYTDATNALPEFSSYAT